MALLAYGLSRLGADSLRVWVSLAAAGGIAFLLASRWVAPDSLLPILGNAQQSDGTTFGLWGGGGRIMPFQPSNGILFAVDDLDRAVAALKERGIAILMENETAVCRMAMINDTEGNMVTFHQRKT